MGAGANEMNRSDWTAGGTASEHDSETIQRDIDRTRANMDETVDAIQARLAPRQLANDAMDGLRDAVRAGAPKLGELVKRHPIPTALIAVGIGWMLVRGNQDRDLGTRRSRRLHRELEDEYDELYGSEFYGGAADDLEIEAELYEDAECDLEGEGEGVGSKVGRAAKRGARAVGEKVGTAAQAVGEKAKGLAQSAGDKASSVAHTVRDKASDLAHRAGDQASDLGHQAKESTARAARQVAERTRHAASRAGQTAAHAAGDLAHRTRDKASQLGHATVDGTRRANQEFWSLTDRRPLAMAGLALAIGAAIGFSLPETRKEDELMGEASDQLKDKARQAGRETADKVQHVAKAAVETAKTEAKELGNAISDSAQGLKEKAAQAGEQVKQAATHVAESAKEEAKRQDLPTSTQEAKDKLENKMS